MKGKRPVNLNLFTIHFPLPAIASILHRISGVFLFFLVPFLLWGLQLSLTSAEEFEQLYALLRSPFSKCVIGVWLAGFIFHLVAGIRHLLMDMGWGESLPGGRLGAKLTFWISAILIILAGVWLW